MSISAINCTTIRPNSVSFGKKPHKTEEDGENKKDPTAVLKTVVATGLVATTGALAAKGISAKLLSKLKTNNELANKSGEFALSAFEFIKNKLSKIDAEKGIKASIRKYGDKALDAIKNFATKGIDSAKLASNIDAEAESKLLGRLTAKIKAKTPDIADDVLQGTLNKEFVAVKQASEGVKKGLSYVVGGSAAVQAFKDPDGDGKLNGEEATKVIGDFVTNLVTSA